MPTGRQVASSTVSTVAVIAQPRLMRRAFATVATPPITGGAIGGRPASGSTRLTGNHSVVFTSSSIAFARTRPSATKPRSSSSV